MGYLLCYDEKRILASFSEETFSKAKKRDRRDCFININKISNFKDGVEDRFHKIYNEEGSKKLLENYSYGKLISQENFNDEGFFIKTFTTLKNIAYKIRNIFTFIADFWIVFVFLVLPVIGIPALIYEAIFKRKK